MSISAERRGWGNPGKPDSLRARSWRKRHIVTIQAYGVPLAVHKQVAPLFSRFINELCSTHNYRLDVRADDWGYANRDVRGRPGVKSNHSWGLAVDLNATTNPLTEDGRVHTDLPAGISQLAGKYGLRWGGDYEGSRKDPMHFEFMGTPAEAQALVAKFTRRRRVDTNPYRVPTLAPGEVIQYGYGSWKVAWVRHQFGMSKSYEFDSALCRQVERFQRNTGLTVDGVVGPETLRYLADV